MASRPKRWTAAAEEMLKAAQILQELQEEYEAWRDNLPENFQDGALAEKLDAVCEIDIDLAEEVANEALNADLPCGFGRD